MIPRLFLNVILTAMFCAVSFAQEDSANTGKEAIDSSEPVKVESVTPEKDQEPLADSPLAPESSAPQQKEQEPPHEVKSQEKKVVLDPTSGDPMSVKITYRGGQLNAWELYKKEAQLAARIKYKNNRPVVVQVYDSDGKLKNGDYKVFYPDGKPKALRSYRQGVQLKETGYYETGQVQYEMKKNKGGKIITFRAYDPEGRLKEGSIKEYYPSGELKGMGTFRKGRPEGSFVSFCEDGAIVAEKEFKKGRLLSKHWKEDTAKSSRICEDAFSYLDSEITPLITVTAKKSCS